MYRGGFLGRWVVRKQLTRAIILLVNFIGGTMSEINDKQSVKNIHMDEAKEHMRAARQAMHKTLEAWLPTGYLEHRRAARKEMLLAMRSMLDAAIQRVDEKKTKDA
jgi:hypothetical protein